MGEMRRVLLPVAVLNELILKLLNAAFICCLKVLLRLAVAGEWQLRVAAARIRNERC